MRRERGKWPNINGEGGALYEHKYSLGNQAKQELALSACQTKGEGRNGTKLVFQASNQNRLKFHKKALIHEHADTKKGVCCTRKGSTAGLMSVALSLIVRLFEVIDAHRVRNGNLQTSANNVAPTSVSLRAPHNKCLRAPYPPSFPSTLNTFP